jgi:serine/threonine protein kinase
MSCDLWSMGVMMYTMLAGRYPFNGADNKILFESIKRGEFDLIKKPWDTIS